VKLTAIDLSPKMLVKAKKKYHKKSLKVKFYCMDAENLIFKDRSFDYIVTAFVLCSIPDPIKALKEMKRVLKKNVKIISIEYVLSKNKLISLWQHIHNPFTKSIFGFNVNRVTESNIRNAGLLIERDTNLPLFDVFRKFVVRKT